jgi:hypothetical protein
MMTWSSYLIERGSCSFRLDREWLGVFAGELGGLLSTVFKVRGSLELFLFSLLLFRMYPSSIDELSATRFHCMLVHKQRYA